MRNEPGIGMELLQCKGYQAVHIRVQLRHRFLCRRVCSKESRQMCLVPWSRNPKESLHVQPTAVFDVVLV